MKQCMARFGNGKGELSVERRETWRWGGEHWDWIQGIWGLREARDLRRFWRDSSLGVGEAPVPRD